MVMCDRNSLNYYIIRMDWFCGFWNKNKDVIQVYKPINSDDVTKGRITAMQLTPKLRSRSISHGQRHLRLSIASRRTLRGSSL
jgi:hypothetical protein